MALKEFDFNTPITEPITLTGEWNCGWDPDNPTLDGFKKAIDDGEEVPIGTEIPDTWDGQSNPLIVGTYQVVSTPDGQKYRAVGLLRKYVEPTAQTFGSSVDYSSSDILSYLNGDYLDKCSDDLKRIISEVSVPYNNGSAISLVNGTWHLFSGVELFGTYTSGEGSVWEYWAQQTGLASANDDTNGGRIRYTRQNAANWYWLRSRVSSSNVGDVSTAGRMSNTAPSGSGGVLPQCWVLSKDPIESSVMADLQKAMQDGDSDKWYPLGRKVLDTYGGAGTLFNWTVVSYDTAKLANGDTENGAYLQADFAMGNASSNSGDYAASNLATKMNEQYQKLSTNTRDLVANISVPYYYNNAAKSVNAKLWVPSATEVWGVYSYSDTDDGKPFQYYKNGSGLSNSSNDNMPVRVLRAGTTSAVNWGLRTWTGTNNLSYINTSGSVQVLNQNATTALALPCVFVPVTPVLVPSVAGLKEALSKGTAKDTYPVGTEIEDTYAGNSNPLIIVQYLDSSNNSTYNGAEGAILLRKYVEPISQQFYRSAGMGQYPVSDIKTFLDTTYLNNCSDELKQFLSPIGVPYYYPYSDGPQWRTVEGKWFLMSGYECTLEVAANQEGIMWDYWKNRASAAVPNNTDDPNRIVYDRDGVARNAWLRSASTTVNRVCYLWTGGRGSQQDSNASLGVLPACFIAKSSGPTLENLQEALESDNPEQLFPVGTEIEDTYDGESNPLVVAQYLNSSNNSPYGGAVGAILVRKFITPTEQLFSVKSNDYSTSDIRTFLNSTYLSNCSTELQNAISPIDVPYSKDNTITQVNDKWFLMSGIEVMATQNAGEGFGWDYWKTQTGLSSANNDANPGRVMRSQKGQAYYWWLRSGGTNYDTQVPLGSVYYVYNNGKIYEAIVDSTVSPTSLAVLPACFIAKKTPESALNGLKEAVDNGTAQSQYPVGTEIEDTYAGNSNPLIVAQYLDSSNNSSYGGAEGVILQRKYVTNYGQAWDTVGNTNYPASTLNTFLNSTYLAQCSDELQAMISDIAVPVVTSSGATTTTGKFFVPSVEEVYGLASANGCPGVGREGNVFQYWQSNAGITSPSNGNAAGRTRKQESESGSAVRWWLRSRNNTGYAYVWAVYPSGNIGDGACGNIYTGIVGVLPCCFIAKTKPVPTLSGLKEAVDNDTAKDTYPVGTEIEDEWNGINNPLIIAQYLDSSNNSQYGGAVGVILVRKYVAPTSQQFANQSTGNAQYLYSLLRTYLNGTYLNNCSEELKGLLSNITVQYETSGFGNLDKVSGKWFPMSCRELCNQGVAYDAYQEGVVFDLWKQRTGLSSPDGWSVANKGRIANSIAGTPTSYWTRSMNSQSVAMVYSGDGSLIATNYYNSQGVLPACFISAS